MEKFKAGVFIADSSDKVEVLEVKQAELRKWTTHNVYDETDDNNQRVIFVGWVLNQKCKDRGIGVLKKNT